MKKVLISLILIGILLFTVLYRNEIVNYIIIITLFSNSYASTPNEYMIEDNFLFVETTDKTIPYNRQDVLNIIYTNLNNGADTISIICPSKYKECLDDTKNIFYDQSLLSNINNYVHPFNTYKMLEISTSDGLAQIEIGIIKNYTETEIKDVNIMVDKIIAENISSTMSDREKIETIHNYIIKHTTFDSEKSDNIDNPNFIDKYKSGTAYGTLINNYAICAGYTDAMSIFLDRFGIVNYRVASTDHIWNLVYLDNTWYHLDLTWDDQTVHNDTILKTYFLITTKQLEEINDGVHKYNKAHFIEAS